MYILFVRYSFFWMFCLLLVCMLVFKARLSADAILVRALNPGIRIMKLLTDTSIKRFKRQSIAILEHFQHDYTLIAFLKTLDGQDIPHTDYTATILVELWEKPGGSKYIKVSR